MDTKSWTNPNQLMKSEFKFNNEYVAQSLIELDNIGDFCLEAINEDDLLYYYLMIKTVMGKSEIVSFGPIIPDMEELPSGYTCSYENIDYSDKRIFIYINKWLNDRGKKITSAKQISVKEFYDNIPDIKDCIQKYVESGGITDGTKDTVEGLLQ